MTGARQFAKPGQARRPVRLRIERLVLHGFAHADRHSIGDGVQTELARMMTDGRTLSSLKNPRALERRDGGTIRIGASASAQATAREIAQAIFRSLEASSADSGNTALMRTGPAGSEEGRKGRG
jgi:hypothetical protein